MSAILSPVFALLFLVLAWCIVWLHVRAFRDGHIQDPVLFVSGISTTSYMRNRWDQARAPVLGGLAAIVLIVLLAIMAPRPNAEESPATDYRGTGSSNAR